jgi:hypothetical protein
MQCLTAKRHAVAVGACIYITAAVRQSAAQLVDFGLEMKAVRGG